MPMGRRSFNLLVGGAILVAAIVVAFLLNIAATRVIEGDGFHSMLEKETAKGLHLKIALYGPITRVGVFGIRDDWGAGQKGEKTIVALKADQVAGAFNPLGMFLRRWQIQFLHFHTGTVWLQRTEPKPNEPKPHGMPWYLFFWPDRLHLKDIKVDDANVLFQLQDKESGLHDTFLEITPNGRDFEYDARGGTFTTPDTPRLNIEHIHLLVRKPKLTCQTLVLGDDPAHPEQQLSVQGEAGLQQDHGIKASADFKSLNVSPWLPEKMRANVLGHFSGHLDYASTGTGLATAQASGHLALADGVVHDLKAFRTFIAATKSPDPGDLRLDVCQGDVALKQGAITVDQVEVESKGVFRLEGHATIAKDKSLSGEMELGVTSAYLKWLPTAETTIFTRADGPYHVAVIHLSGTSKKPVQDLSPRILTILGKHPFVALKLFFNSSSVLFGG
jgi:hypothetical protein